MFGFGFGFGFKSYGSASENLLLDTYSGAAAAYSLRKLKSTTTNVVRVRRSSDNAELDFTAAQITDGTLTTWTGANDGFVTTIYDQASSNNMTQTTASLQGQIVSSGSVITLGGKPCIIRSSDNDGGYISTYAPNDGATVKGLFYVGDNNSKSCILLGSATGAQDYNLNSQNGIIGVSRNNVTITSSKINGANNDPLTRQASFDSTDLHFLLYQEVEFSFGNNLLGLGYRRSSPINLGMYTFQEMVIFGNTTDAVAKENNINTNYSIY